MGTDESQGDPREPTACQPRFVVCVAPQDTPALISTACTGFPLLVSGRHLGGDMTFPQLQAFARDTGLVTRDPASLRAVWTALVPSAPPVLVHVPSASHGTPTRPVYVGACCTWQPFSMHALLYMRTHGHMHATFCVHIHDPLCPPALHSRENRSIMLKCCPRVDPRWQPPCQHLLPLRSTLSPTLHRLLTPRHRGQCLIPWASRWWWPVRGHRSRGWWWGQTPHPTRWHRIPQVP
jgi:hypothetical protein